MLNQNSNGKAPDLHPYDKKIDWVINHINSGGIKIPAFQRGFVWKPNQIVELLESIVRQYPIGSILLWESSEKLQSSRNIAGYDLPYMGENYPVQYVLDGQQRLSSIYGVLSSNETHQENVDSRYAPERGIFEIAYHFKQEKFLPISEISDTEQRTSAMLLKNLLSASHFNKAVRKLNQKYIDDADNLQTLFNNYSIPIVEIKNREKEDVGVIFERINNTGTRLQVFDLMTAWTWTNGFHLLNHVQEMSAKLEDSGFGELKEKTVLQIIGGIIIGSTRTEKILKMDTGQIRDNWSVITQALESAVDFLRDEFKCRHIDFLPHSQQLVALCRFFAYKKQINAKQIAALKKYFWCTAFSDRYATGRTTEKMDEDIKSINSLIDYDYSAFEKYTYTVNIEKLFDAKLLKTNPLARSVLLLLAQYSPRSLLNGRAVALDTPLSNYNKKELHHVFPDKFLKEQGVEELAVRDSILNFCFLPSLDNKKISDNAPSKYFKNIASEECDSILASNLLPNDKEIYNKDNYSLFRKMRAELIMEKIEEQATGNC